MKIDQNRIKEELIRAGLTQRQLADKIGKTEQSVSRYIHGERMPRGNTLVKICQALNTTPEYLTDLNGMDRPDIAFARVRVSIRDYARDWTREQKRELAIMLIDRI